MGTSFSPLPLGEIIEDERDLAWFRRVGLTLPTHMGPSRFPTPNEILAVVSGAMGCEADASTPFADLEISVDCGDRHAIIWVEDFSQKRNNDAPQSFSFYRGDRSLVVEIVERLSHICGPFLLTDAENFLIVQPSTTPEEAWTSP